MGLNRINDFENTLIEMLEQRRLMMGLGPIMYGGSSGPGGGTGTGPGGTIGLIIQTLLAYDTTELATVHTPVLTQASGLDNLNHIRAAIRSAGHIHGLSTWQVVAGTLTIELVDFWEELDWVVVNGFMFNPLYVGLNDEHSQIVFNAALASASIVTAQGVIARTDG